MAYDALVSCAYEDKAAGKQVCETLEDAGHRCWSAYRDVTPGEPIQEAIDDGIAGCRVVVVLLSRHSAGETTVHRPLWRAAERGLPIVPVRIEDVTLPESIESHLAGHQGLETSGERREAYGGRVVALVQRLL